MSDLPKTTASVLPAVTVSNNYYFVAATGNVLERRANQFYWRGRYFSGLVDVKENVLYDDPVDSFWDHVFSSSTVSAEET